MGFDIKSIFSSEDNEDNNATQNNDCDKQDNKDK